MNTSYLIGIVIGSAIMTYLISRLLLWPMRSWNGGVTKFVMVHLLSLLIAAFIGATTTMTDGNEFAGLRAAAVYAPAQIFWFLVDMIRHWRVASQEEIKTPRKSFLLEKAK